LTHSNWLAKHLTAPGGVPNLDPEPLRASGDIAQDAAADIKSMITAAIDS
jgi:hypothetical protein